MYPLYPGDLVEIMLEIDVYQLHNDNYESSARVLGFTCYRDRGCVIVQNS